MWCPRMCGGGVVVIVVFSVDCESGMYAGAAHRLGEVDVVDACGVFIVCMCACVSTDAMMLLMSCCDGMKS